LSFGSRPVLGGEILAANEIHAPQEWLGIWDEPDALADIAFTAGVLGLIAGLLAVGRLSGTHFPDTLFWRALPLLLTLPPALFLGALCAPGGLLEPEASERSRAARLALSGLLSYVAPVILLSIVAALACLR
jgi:hypothetical protein